MGYVKSENERGSPTSSRHHHHHHHRRGAKTPREPSINSLSSSDISSETSSAIHRKTTPKIAAVIIAAIIVIAALVGITIYLIDADRFEKQAIAVEQEESNNIYQSPSIRPDPAAAAVDYQTYRDESSAMMEKHQSDTQPQNSLSKNEESNASTTVKYRFGKDPEGPHDAAYEEYYEEKIQDESSAQDLVVDGQGGALSKEFYPHQRDDIMPPNHMQRAGGHMRGLHQDRQGGVFQRVMYQNNQPYGAKLPPSSQEQDWSPSLRAPETQEHEVPTDGREHIYNMEPFVDQQGRVEGRPPLQGNFPRRMLRPGQRFRRPGTLISEPVSGSLLKTDASIQVNDEAMLPKISSDQIPPLGDDITHHPLPPSGSRGGVHIPVESAVDDLIQRPNVQDNAGITTLDRRPGRPIFHHMGPGQTRPINRNILMRRRQHAMLQRRMGMFPNGGDSEDPLKQAERLLSKFDRIVTLAESEMKVLKQIGENITSEGKDINLWEVMTAVNNTIKDNPDSALGRLMDRFYNKYLMETNQIEDNAFPMTDQIYEKSLSSLLFLSFGIFLLNSVNELIAHKGLDQSRSFTNNNNSLILKNLLTQHDELLDVFPHVIKDRIHENMEKSNGSISHSHEPPTINSFLRLLMNLMNAYNSGDEEEVECIWALYCHQLNQQAALGGMVSSVARINSVGMRVLLKQVPSSHAIRLMFKNLMQWKDLDCETMFPTCSAQIRMKLEDQQPSSATTSSSSSVDSATDTNITSSTTYQSR